MNFSWNKDDINVKISRLLDTIVNLANEDNVISEDEHTIIEATRQKLWGLKKEFETMIDQNVNIQEAQSRTKKLLEQVITGVTDAAKQDNKITSDELILIDRIATYLRNSDFTELVT